MLDGKSIHYNDHANYANHANHTNCDSILSDVYVVRIHNIASERIHVGGDSLYSACILETNGGVYV